MNLPIVSTEPWIQLHYEKCRLEGTSHKLAEMFAFAQPPMSNSEREFMEGRWNQFEKTPHLGDAYAAESHSKGISTKGKIYLHSLASYPGDPKAWVSDKGDVARVCEERGWDCDGAVKVRSHALGPKKAGPAVADDIVAAEVPGVLASGQAKTVEEAKEKIIQKRKPHWAKGG